MAVAAQSFAPEQFLHPLDVIRSEHDRQLLVCDRLVELAKDFQLEPVAEEAETLLAYGPPVADIDMPCASLRVIELSLWPKVVPPVQHQAD